MIRKYIYILAIAVVLVAVLAIPAMQKPKVPEKPFPISEESINTAIKNAGLELSLGEKTVLDNEKNKLTSYLLMDKDNKIAAFLQMSYFGERKQILVHTQTTYNGSRGPLPQEEFHKLPFMLSELYGGFDDNNKPYNDFLNENDLKKIKEVNWLKKYGNIYYSISMNSANDGGNLNLIDRVDAISVGITNGAGLQSNIEITEKNLKDNKERLASRLAEGDKKSLEIIESYEKSLEKLKSIK